MTGLKKVAVILYEKVRRLMQKTYEVTDTSSDRRGRTMMFRDNIVICSDSEEQVEIRSGEKRKMAERPAMIYSLEMAALTKPQEILIWSHQDEQA